MSIRIAIRRDTTVNWASANPILANGEPGIDSTQSIIKYGDGITAWLDLPVSAAVGQGIVDSTARTAAANAQSTATSAATAASNAQTTATNAQTAATNNLATAKTYADTQDATNLTAAKTYTDGKLADTGWVTAGFSMATGVTSSQTLAVRRIGQQVYIQATSLSIDSVNVAVNGDFGNRALFTVPTGFVPSQSGQALPSAQSGRLGSFYIDSTGVVSIASTVPDATQTATTTISPLVCSLGGSYVL